MLDGYIRNRLIGSVSSHEEIYPPADLSEEQLEDLLDRLTELMPLDSIIVDLWNWDVHFEDYLDNDWFFEAAFGGIETLNGCAEELADSFLEKVDEFDMDYDQYPEYDIFQSKVREESRKFIAGWRNNVLSRYGPLSNGPS